MKYDLVTTLSDGKVREIIKTWFEEEPTENIDKLLTTQIRSYATYNGMYISEVFPSLYNLIVKEHLLRSKEK